jgi:EAL and modified HD-GYP domain-containing signal transduction protein
MHQAVSLVETQAQQSAADETPQDAAALRYMGCQPILDASYRLFGHELLFRSGPKNAFSGDGVDATRQVIDGALTMSLDATTGDGKIFVNCTREALTEELVTLLPAQRTVLEILETLEVDDEIFNACVKLKKNGYEIALDDYTPNPSMDRLLELADYAKLDFRACDEPTLDAIRKHLAPYKMQLLAEKVETEQEFELGRVQGFIYFQGYFFAKPLMLEEQDIAPDKTICLQLLAMVTQPDCDRMMIERLLMTDSALCFRLLRLVNSAGMGIRNPIRTVKQAMLMIGERELYKLIVVASAMRLADENPVAKQLIVLALRRARFCELMAPAARQSGGEQYLIGMLSAMDAMLRTPIRKVLEKLPLRQEAAGVLLGEQGLAAYPLQLLLAYEAQDWPTVDRLCSRMHVPQQRLIDVFGASQRWGSEQIKGLLA